MARIVVLASDLLIASRIQSGLATAGHEVALGADPHTAELVVVDCMEDGVDLEALGALGVPKLGFFAHTQPQVRERALDAGFDQVVPRSRLVRELEPLVAKLLVGA